MRPSGFHLFCGIAAFVLGQWAGNFLMFDEFAMVRARDGIQLAIDQDRVELKSGESEDPILTAQRVLQSRTSTFYFWWRTMTGAFIVGGTFGCGLAVLVDWLRYLLAVAREQNSNAGGQATVVSTATATE